jgi:hypothetical protein
MSLYKPASRIMLMKILMPICQLSTALADLALEYSHDLPVGLCGLDLLSRHQGFELRFQDLGRDDAVQAPR